MSGQSNIFSKFAERTVWDFIISRGIVCLIIGILFITMPEASINMLCILLGVFLVLNGILALVKAFKTNNDKKIFLLYGLICLFAGLIILMAPTLLAGIIVTIFALLILISGGNQIVVAIQSKSTPGSARIFAALTGLISIGLGLALLLRPDIGLQVIIMLIGIYFVAFGVLAIATGSVIRKANKKGHTIIG